MVESKNKTKFLDRTKTVFKYVWNTLLVLFVGILANAGVAFLLMSFDEDYRWNFLWGLLMFIPFFLWIRKLPCQGFITFQIFTPIILLLIFSFVGGAQYSPYPVWWLDMLPLVSLFLFLIIQLYFVKRYFGWKTFTWILAINLAWTAVACTIVILTRHIRTMVLISFPVYFIIPLIPQYLWLKNHGGSFDIKNTKFTLKVLFKYIWNALLALFIGILANAGVVLFFTSLIDSWNTLLWLSAGILLNTRLVYLLMSILDYRYNYLLGLLLLIPFILWIHKLPHKLFTTFQIFCPAISLLFFCTLVRHQMVPYVGGPFVYICGVFLLLAIQLYFMERYYGWKTFFITSGPVLALAVSNYLITLSSMDFRPFVLFSLVIFLFLPIIPQYWRLKHHGRK